MKKFTAVLLSAVIALLPATVQAQSTEGGQKQTINGNFGFNGYATADNLNPMFTAINPSSGISFDFVTLGNGHTPYTIVLNTDQVLTGAPTTSSPSGVIPITGFNLFCPPYNSTLAASPGYFFSGAETNGIGGGTITVLEAKPTGAAVTVGTVVLPTSAHNGPYVNHVTSILGTPYIPTAHSVFTAYVSSFDSTPSTGYNSCTLTATLQ